VWQVHDLVYRANISLFEALLGFSLNVTSVDNRSVEVMSLDFLLEGERIIDL
jgi:hypothetical protein